MSVVIPCYNEEKSIVNFYRKFIEVYENNLKKEHDLFYELIFVDDGSRDNTLNILKDLSGDDENVKYISFSRNFGKEAALFAGLRKSKGDYVVTMDVDLQDPPSLLPRMFDSLLNEDYDSIATRRVSRKGEPIIRSFFARGFYRFFNFISRIDLVDGARDYRLMTRQVVDSILELNEYNRFSKGIFNWVGYKTKWMEYENIERVEGESHWSLWSLFKYSIEGIVAFSTVPLSISTLLGIIFSIVSFIFIILIVLKRLLFGDAVQGWTSTICIILLLGGIQLFSIGILGKYLEKVYAESKNRPAYIIKEDNL